MSTTSHNTESHNDQTGLSISNIVDAIQHSSDPMKGISSDESVKDTSFPSSIQAMHSLSKGKRSYKKRNTHINTSSLSLNNSKTRNHISHFGWIESQQQVQLEKQNMIKSQSNQENIHYSFLPALQQPPPPTPPSHHLKQDISTKNYINGNKNVFYSYMPQQHSRSSSNSQNNSSLNASKTVSAQQQQQQHHHHHRNGQTNTFQNAGGPRAPVSFPSPFCNPNSSASTAASAVSTPITTANSKTSFNSITPSSGNYLTLPPITFQAQNFPLSFTFGNPIYHPSFLYDSMDNYSSQHHQQQTTYHQMLQHPPHPSPCHSSTTSSPSSSVKFVNSTAELIHSQCKQQEDSAQRKKRTRTSANQLDILQTSFNADPMPNSSGRMAIAKAVGMNARAVQVWFQNRRAKEKSDIQAKKLSFNISISSPKVNDKRNYISPRNSSSSSSSSSSFMTTATANSSSISDNNFASSFDGMSSGGTTHQHHRSRSASLSFNSLPNYASSTILPSLSLSRSCSPTPFCDLGLYFGGSNGGGGGGLNNGNGIINSVGGDPFNQNHSLILNSLLANGNNSAINQPFIGNASLRQLRPLSPFSPSSPNHHHHHHNMTSLESSFESGVSSLKSLTRSSSPSTLLSSYLLNEDSPSFVFNDNNYGANDIDNSINGVQDREQYSSQTHSPPPLPHQQQQQQQMRRQSLLHGGYHQGNCLRDDAIFSKPTGGETFLPFPTSNNAASFDLLGRDIVPLRKGGRSLSVPDVMHYRSSSYSKKLINALEEEDGDGDVYEREGENEENYSRKMIEKNAISSLQPLDDISNYLDNSINI